MIQQNRWSVGKVAVSHKQQLANNVKKVKTENDVTPVPHSIHCCARLMLLVVVFAFGMLIASFTFISSHSDKFQ